MQEREGIGRAPNWLARAARSILVGYWVALFVGTHVPLLPDMSRLPGSDKTLHMAGYFGLAFLLALTLSLRRVLMLSGYGRILAVLIVYAICDELLQIPVGRSASFWDCSADVLGSTLGLIAYAVVRSAGQRWGLWERRSVGP